MSNRKLGNLAEAKAISVLTEENYSVSIPFTENNNYDLVIEKNNKFFSVQVKGTKYEVKENTYRADLRSVSHNTNGVVKSKKRKEEDYDFLFVYTPRKNYLIKSEDIDGKSAIYLHENRKYNEKSLI